MDQFVREAFRTKLLAYYPWMPSLQDDNRERRLKPSAVVTDHAKTVIDAHGNVMQDNTRYPQVNVTEPQLRTSLLPAPSSVASLGSDGGKRLNGIYQIDVFVPQGHPDFRHLSQEVDELIRYFRRGGMGVVPDALVRDGDGKPVPDSTGEYQFQNDPPVVIHLTEAWASQELAETKAGLVFVPVNVPYFAYVFN